jgi:hypothetical protein
MRVRPALAHWKSLSSGGFQTALVLAVPSVRNLRRLN